jgi:mRNA interferase MazF
MAKLPHRPRSQKETIGTIRRGEIYLCMFDPTGGHEIRKTRPALIIQNDIGNRYSPLTIVAALTSKVSPVPYPVEVVIEPTSANGLDIVSSIRLNQIRAVDRRRLIRRLGVLDAKTMAKVEDAIKVSLGMVSL